MQKTEAAMILAGVKPEEQRQASAPTNLHVITGTVSGKSTSGKTQVLIDGLVFTSDNSQYIEIDTLGGLEEGDTATILLTGENGRGMTPLAVGAPGSIDRIDVRITSIEADYVKATVLDAEIARLGYVTADTVEATYATIDSLNAEKARISSLETNSATVENLEAAEARIHNLEVDHVTIDDFEAEQAKITNLQSATADISTIRANSAKVNDLTAEQLTAATGYIGDLQTANITAQDISAASGYIQDLESDNITAQDIIADHATVDTLDATYATIDSLDAEKARISTIEADYLQAADMTAEQARVGELLAGKASVSDLNAATGRISNLEAADVSITGRLDAAEAVIDDLDATYLHTDLLNADVAWIQNGTIKDGAIVNGMIQSVSANKLTAGTIDASNITVTNLNADNITTGTINGQRIGAGSLSLDKLEEDVYTETEVNDIIAGLQTQIDGAIETWTGTDIPTLQNFPAVNWTTNVLKDAHVGDVYFVVNSNSQQNGYNYRFTKSDNTYSWQLIKDSDVTNALARLTTAEGKIGTIEQFDQDISSWRTNTDSELSSIKQSATTLAGRVTTAEGQISTKVEQTVFNTLSQTVDENTSSIQSLTTETTTLTNKLAAANPYVYGTQTANTYNWTGVADTLETLEDGQQITYWLPYTSGGSSVSAPYIKISDGTSVNTSGAALALTLKDGTVTNNIPVWYGSGVSRITTHYAGGTVLHLTYRENAVVSNGAYRIAEGWFQDANYDTNTPYTRYSDTVVAGKNGLKRYSLCMKDDAGNWTSVVNEANNTGVSGKTCYAGGLQLGNILYHYTSSDIAAGGNSGALWETYGGIDFRYSVNGITTGTTTHLQMRKPVYFVGTIGNDGLFYLDSSKWWTQTPNETGKVYSLIGTAYSSYYAIYLAADNPTYIYEDGELIELQQSRYIRTTNKINEVTDTVDEHTRKLGVLETTVENKADGSTVTTISNRLNTVSDTVNGHTQTLTNVTQTVAQADEKADTALQTALDGAFLVLTSTNGQLFKNGAESTILQVAIFPNGGDRCDTLSQVRDRFGETAYIEWKWMHESSGEWGTMLSTDSHISHDGMWLTVGPNDVATKTTFSASLVVPGEED